jgi:hypothetical protein
VSLVVIAVTAAVAASLGYLASRRREEAAEPSGKKPASPESPKDDEAEAKEEPAPATLKGLSLALGDVVSAEGEERWLAGVIVARDGQRVAAGVFIAPEGIGHRAVVAFSPPERHLFWLAPAEVTTPSEPPATLEIGNVAMRRRGRVPVTLARAGTGAPSVGTSGILATYESTGREVALVLTSEGRTLAWSGVRLDEGEYDRMGSAGED